MKYLFLIASLFASAQGVTNNEQALWLQHTEDGISDSKAGRYAAAEQRFRIALLEAERFGAGDRRLWASLSNLAFVRGEQGALADAETLYRRVLELRERALGPNDTTVAATLNNLAGTLRLEARLAEADPLLRRALAIAEAAGDDHLTAVVLNTLALTLSDANEKVRAEPVLRRSLALFEKVAGPEHLETGKAANNLANLYREAGDFDKAELMQRRGLAIFEARLPAGHPTLATGLNNLFNILMQQNRAAEAEPYLRRALAIADAADPNGLTTAQIRANMATVESNRGNYTLAAGILKHVIAARERLLGPDHPLVATSLENYSAALRKLHQNGEAKRAQARANAIFKMAR
jgi:tetratricopeptide (TPR) repeat protein